MKRIRQWWKWRVYNKEDWPYRYTGKSLPFIEYGLPLQPVSGPRGAPGAKRYLSPDGYVRLIHTNEIGKR